MKTRVLVGEARRAFPILAGDGGGAVAGSLEGSHARDQATAPPPFRTESGNLRRSFPTTWELRGRNRNCWRCR